MHEITGISASQRASLERDARQLVSTYDRSGDDSLSRNETERFNGSTSDTYRTRSYYNDDLVEVTTVYRDNFKAIKDDEFRAADSNRDGRLTAREMVHAYLDERDTNHDGNLSTWEKLKMSFTGVSGKFERFWSVETDRRSRTVYDPMPRYEDPYRPTPPRTDPRPPYYNDRPTPPRVDPSPSRPTPPPPRNDRPAPPPVSRNGRPAPPPLY